MPAPSLNDIVKLLVSMYTTDELRALARELDEGVVHTLPEGRGTLAVAERVAEATLHRGLSEALRTRLLEERPGRAHDIAVLWGRSVDSRRERMIETVSAAIEEQGGDPFRCFEAADGEEDDVLYDTFRAMTLSRSRASWPYIARMTADYLVNRGGKTDFFFLRAAWLLERCEDEDIAILRRAFAACEESLEYTNSPVGVARGTIRSEAQFTFNGSALTVNTSPGTDGGERELEIEARNGETRGDVAKRQFDVVVLLGESRLGWYKGGTVKFRLRDGVPEAGGILHRLLDLFRR